MESFTLSFIRQIRLIVDNALSSTEVHHQLKRCLLDWTGVSFAGAKEMGNKLDSSLEISGTGDCSVFLSKQRRDLVSAASINGFLSHVMELDDGHRFGMLHLGAPVISAMLSVGQKEGLSYRQFAKGVIVGYQTTVQIARFLQPYHKQKGYHATGTCGTIGVAAAIAAALDFPDYEFENALGAATTSASGLLSVIDSPSEMKPFNVACAVESGIRAAYLAKAGIRGPIDPLLGKRGFLRVFSPKTEAVDDLSINTNPEILSIYFKPYVSCRHCHAPIEATLNLRSRYNISWEDTKDILVETYFLAIVGHDNTEVDSVSAAKMSTPFCVATSLVYGTCGLDSFNQETINNCVVKGLMQKVRVIEDKELSGVSPQKRGARVTITLNDGNHYTEFIDNPLGEPERPMSDKMLEDKYHSLMRFAGVEKGLADEICEKIWCLEKDYDEFLRII